MALTGSCLDPTQQLSFHCCDEEGEGRIVNRMSGYQELLLLDLCVGRGSRRCCTCSGPLPVGRIVGATRNETFDDSRLGSRPAEHGLIRTRPLCPQLRACSAWTDVFRVGPCVDGSWLSRNSSALQPWSEQPCVRPMLRGSHDRWP